jgi:hypothetical protein
MSTSVSPCREDLLSTTSFVTWSLHSGNRNGLNSVLGPVGNPNPKPAARAAAAAAAAPAPAEVGRCRLNR